MSYSDFTDEELEAAILHASERVARRKKIHYEAVLKLNDLRFEQTRRAKKTGSGTGNAFPKRESSP